MDETIKAKWVEDLNSGNFPKGVGRLHKVRRDAFDRDKVEHSFCCLGVLCEQAVAAGVADRTLIGNEEFGHYVYHPAGTEYTEGIDSNSNYLPAFVKQWAGLNDANPRVDTPTDVDVKDYGTRVSVATLNDEVYGSFDKIAELVERNF